jgi:predicted nucleic acid-binding protein
MFLLDANIFLELLLDRGKSDSVRTLFNTKDPADLNISDLSLHSIGIILYRKGAAGLFTDFVRDLFGNGGMQVLALSIDDICRVEQVAATFRLDFDDAYQYTIAEKYQLTLVSFDADFDRTDRKRATPAEIA